MAFVIPSVCEPEKFRSRLRDYSSKFSARFWPVPWKLPILSALLLIGFGTLARATAPPAVQYLGIPTQVFTSGISFPIGMAEDANGNVYIAEYSGDAVYKETLQPDGTYVRSTVAAGFSTGPVGLAIDSVGNVYIGLDLSGGTSRLLKETLQGNGSYVQSFIGTCSNDVYGIVVDGSGNVFATCNPGTNTVIKFAPSGSTYTPSTIFTSPGAILAGLALDASGNVFVAKEYTNIIYKLTPVGSPATTTSYTSSSITIGTGTSAFDLALDSSGDLFVADSAGKVRLEVPNGGGGYTETILASGLTSVYGITVGPSGTIYFGSGGAVDEFAPVAVNMGSPNLTTATAAFTLNYTIQPGTVIGAINVVSEGVVNTQSGSPEFVNAGGGTCAVQSYGALTVCSVKVTFIPQFTGLQTGAVQILDTGGNILNNVLLYGIGKAPIAGFSSSPAGLLSITGLGSTPLSGARHPVMDVAGNLYIADSGNNRIVKVAPGGAGTILSTPGFTLDSPTAVAIDGAGNLYIADSGNGRVIELNAQGVASALNTNSLALAANYGVAVDGLGNVYTSDATNNRVIEFPNLGSAHVLSTTGVTLGSAYGVAADGSGNVYIADESNSRIIKVTNGAGTVLSTGTLSPALVNPEDVAVDAPGNLYISDTGNNRIVEVSSGSANAVALNTAGYVLNAPTCAAIDNVETLYICDSQNNRIVTSNQEAAAALTFPTPNVTDTITLFNLGNLALTLSVPTTGKNPGFGTTNFSLPSAGNVGYCPQLSTTSSAANIAAGASCLLAVEFTPAGGATGALTDSLTITDNHLRVAASTQTIAVSGTALNSPTVTLTASPASPIDYGQAQTFLAVTVSYTSGTPTGTVAFTDNNNSLGSSVALTAGAASLAAQYYLPGSHTFEVSYSGDSTFDPNNSSVVTYVVNKASSTVSGPLSAVQVVHGAAGSIAVGVAGESSGAGILAPSGSVTYSIADSGSNVVASGTAAIASGAATVPVADTLASGIYTVTLGYLGDTNYNAAAAANVQLHVGALTPTIAWAQPAPITYATNLSGVLNATASVNSTPVAGSFTYSATSNGGSAVAVTAATQLSAGSYTLTATFTPANTSDFTGGATGSVSLIVRQAAPSITLATSVNPVLLTNPTTLTATVASNAGTPTGSINFLDGSTLLGSVSLSNGIAALSLSSFAVGSHSISAVYSGDPNFSAASSTVLTQTVIDFTATPGSGSGASGGSGGSGGGDTAPSQTVAPGSTATYTLSIVPTAGTTLPTPTVFTITGMPSGAVASISPATWAPTAASTWTYPANTGLQNITLAIQLPSATARNKEGVDFGRRTSALLLGLLLLPFAGKMRCASRRMGKWSAWLIAMAAGCSLVAGISGCASTNGFFAQPAHTYTITETVTSGTLSHSATITLTVE